MKYVKDDIYMKKDSVIGGLLRECMEPSMYYVIQIMWHILRITSTWHILCKHYVHVIMRLFGKSLKNTIWDYNTWVWKPSMYCVTHVIWLCDCLERSVYYVTQKPGQILRIALTRCISHILRTHYYT